MIKLLTCQTWVTEWEWFDYAQHHHKQVPFFLVDRSPCTEPFLDPHASPGARRPMMSGLCRLYKQSLRKNDVYIYITRVERRKKLYEALDISWKEREPHYLGVAALIIVEVYPSHADAAAAFECRQYVVAPNPTPYPPNLAHDPQMPAAVRRESCIVTLDQKTSYTPYHSTEKQWEDLVGSYYDRQQKHRLRAAECRLLQKNGREVLRLDPLHAPVLTSADWGNREMVRGVLSNVPKKWAAHLCQKIIQGR